MDEEPPQKGEKFIGKHMIGTYGHRLSVGGLVQCPVLTCVGTVVLKAYNVIR